MNARSMDRKQNRRPNTMGTNHIQKQYQTTKMEENAPNSEWQESNHTNDNWRTYTIPIPSPRNAESNRRNAKQNNQKLCMGRRLLTKNSERHATKPNRGRRTKST